MESGPLSGGENCLSYKSACRNRKIEEFVEPIRDAARFPELFSRELSFLIFSAEGKQGSKIQGHEHDESFAGRKIRPEEINAIMASLCPFAICISLTF